MSLNVNLSKLDVASPIKGQSPVQMPLLSPKSSIGALVADQTVEKAKEPLFLNRLNETSKNALIPHEIQDVLARFLEDQKSIMESSGHYLHDFFSKASVQVKLVLNPSSILQPKVEMLEQIASYYEKKYNILIKIVSTSEELGCFVRDLQSNQDEKVYGIIYDPIRNGHVTSIIVDTKGSKALVLDVMDSATIKNFGAFGSVVSCEEQLKSLGFEIAASYGIRQADTRSCRTEATVMLRNLLLYLKAYSEKTLGDVIEEFAIQDPIGTYLMERNMKRVFLPIECLYVDQIRPGWNGGIHEIGIIRRLFSKQESKKMTKESVADFIKRYSFPTKQSFFCFNFQNDDLNQLKDFQAFEEKEAGTFQYKSADFSMRVVGSQIYFRMGYVKPMYHYLVLKGYRNAQKYDPDHAPTMPNMGPKS